MATFEKILLHLARISAILIRKHCVTQTLELPVCMYKIIFSRLIKLPSLVNTLIILWSLFRLKSICRRYFQIFLKI